MSVFRRPSREAPSPSEIRAELTLLLWDVGRPPPRKASRATLPDVDFSIAVRQPRRSLLERLFGAPRSVRKHHKPNPRAV